MKLWYTNNSPFTSYTTVTPHSDSRSDSSAYVTSHVQYTTYKIIACIERATCFRHRLIYYVTGIGNAIISCHHPCSALAYRSFSNSARARLQLHLLSNLKSCTMAEASHGGVHRSVEPFSKFKRYIKMQCH